MLYPAALFGNHNNAHLQTALIKVNGVKLPTILVPSASYILSDYLLTSEGTFCYNLFKNMAKYGYEFEVASNYIRVNRPLSNTRFHQVGTFEPRSQPNMKAVAYTEFMIRSMLKSRKILKKREVDLIHHLLPAVYNQTFSLLVALKLMKDLPFVFGPISAHVTSMYKRSMDERFLMPVTAQLHKRAVDRCDKIITITKQVKRLYEKWIDEKKIAVIPFAVDTGVFKPARSKVYNGDEILYVGSLYPIKAVDWLIRSMALVVREKKSVKLRIVGDGPEKNRLFRLASSLGIEKNVKFEGLVPYTRVTKYFQKCDVFVYVTLGEPFGRSIIEAMACGKPTIASTIGGPAEIIEHEKTGLLVPPMRPQILCKKILMLLEDSEKRRELGQKARARVLEKYSWAAVSKAYDGLYRTLI